MGRSTKISTRLICAGLATIRESARKRIRAAARIQVGARSRSSVTPTVGDLPGQKTQLSQPRNLKVAKIFEQAMRIQGIHDIYMDITLTPRVQISRQNFIRIHTEALCGCCFDQKLSGRHQGGRGVGGVRGWAY